MAALGSVVCDEARRIFDCEEVHVYMSNPPVADPTAGPPTLELVAVSGAPVTVMVDHSHCPPMACRPARSGVP